MDHLAGQGRENFYLYTDSLCTYAFHEKQGMTRAASKDMQFRLDGEPENLGAYLYSGRVR